MSVTGIVVTRGDHNYAPSLANWPITWQRIVWDNGAGTCRVWYPEAQPFEVAEYPVPDLAVYGRYAAIERADGDLIYVQDDDVIVSDPAALVSKWVGTATISGPVPEDGSDLTNVFWGGHVVCNMPPEFRHEFYEDHALVGFGAVFHRYSPAVAFDKFTGVAGITAREGTVDRLIDDGRFLRTCDIVFTGLAPRVLVDVPKVDRDFATDDTRMYRQPLHISERGQMRELVRKVIGAQ